MFKNVTLDVGLCSCIEDWRGKLQGRRFFIGNTGFTLQEHIIGEHERFYHHSHLWIDRHFLSMREQTYCHTIIQVRQAAVYQPEREDLKGRQFAVFDRMKPLLHGWYDLSPTPALIQKRITALMWKVVQQKLLDSWLAGFETTKHLPVLG